jgi:hypothetical protein
VRNNAFISDVDFLMLRYWKLELALMKSTSEALDSRALVLQIRAAVSQPTQAIAMPESAVWGAYIELRRRGEPEADRRFIQALRTLHSRRSNGVAEIALNDCAPREHLESADPFLGELFKAYKKCLQRTRFAPAAKLIRDMEDQIQTA